MVNPCDKSLAAVAGVERPAGVVGVAGMLGVLGMDGIAGGRIELPDMPDAELRGGMIPALPGPEAAGGNEPVRDDKLTVKRGMDGRVRARIVFSSFCLLDEEYAPSVDYLEGTVRIRVQRNFDEITLHCSCTTKMTFTLTRAVPRGTQIVFGFGSYEPHLRAIAP